MGDVGANRRDRMPCMGRRANMLSRRPQFERRRRRSPGERPGFSVRPDTPWCGRRSGRFEAERRTRSPRLCPRCRGRAVLADSRRRGRRGGSR